AIPPPDIHKIRRQVTQSFSKAPRFSAMNQKKAGQGELSGQSAIAPAGANAPRVLEGNQAPRSNLV
ncbi:hypothetical protein, partial [Burkholderia pseudomallei]|uniref:hypothetical protein n=1 Tax=Burkholderia pseudomallei TaxID=28450 RepID=UPI0019D33E9C